QQVLNERSGGWPLTMFLTPKDQMPFFGGTYFPDQARHGLPAFKDTLERIAQVYRERREDIENQNRSMSQVLKRVYEPMPPGDLSPELPDAVVAQSKQVF